VFYDEFTVSRAATIGRVLDALGIDPPAPQGKKPMQRQADDRSRDWVARFRSDSEHRQRI
jgi:LPS sulfotransferase NodH